MRALIFSLLCLTAFACRDGSDCDCTDTQVCVDGTCQDAPRDAGHTVDAGVDAGPGDTTPPTVVQTVPQQSAVDVAVATHVVITFSEPMDPSALLFSVTPSLELQNPGWSADHTELTLTPAQPLAFKTNFAVLLDGKDVAGNALAHFELDFATADQADDVAPTLEATLPADGTTSAAVGTSFTLTFSEPMDRATVTLRTTPATTLGAPQWAANDTEVTFTPSAPLTASQGYVGLVAGEDLAGNALDPTTASFSFTTAAPPDVTPPTLVSSTPQEDALNVPADARLSLTFSEAMNTASVMVDATPLNPQGAGTWSPDERTVTFAAPPADWEFGTHYTLSLSGTDRAGNPLASGTQLSFDVVQPPDTTPPTVLSTVPTDGNGAVPFTSTLELAFSEPMNQASVEAALTVAPALTCTFTWNASRTLLVCAHGTPFPPQQAYSVTLGTGAQDDAGNHLAQPFTFGFTSAAAPDTTPPTIVTTTPANNAVGIAPTVGVGRTPTPLLIEFSEPMRQSETQAAFSVTTPSGTAPGTFAWDSTGTRLKWTPATSFVWGQQVVFQVNTGAADLAGNHLAATYTGTFRIKRRVALTLYASGSTYLGGSSRLDGTIAGAADCSSVTVSGGSATAIAGDRYVRLVNGGAYRGYLSFKISELTPAAYPNAIIASAQLVVSQLQCTGDPLSTAFGGAIVAQHVTYGTVLDSSDCALPALNGFTANLSTDLLTGTHGATVTAAVADDVANLSSRGGQSQFELRTATVTNDLDVTSDACSYGTYNQAAQADAPYLAVLVEYD